jgi:putative Mg2+ transporter-C (MgtC) family protein
MVTQNEILIRLLLAAVLGAVVGFERERQNQPAGLRTHIILTVGSALAMTLSINLAIQFRPLVPNGDPARLAAQVISGIGFLGAGAILHFGTNVKGLTTATSLWTMAIVGLSVGAGYYLVSVAAIVLLIIALTILNTIEKRFIRTYSSRVVTLQAADRPGLLKEFRKTLRKMDQSVVNFGIYKDIDQNLVTLNATIRTIEDPDLDPLVDALSQIRGIKSFNIH